MKIEVLGPGCARCIKTEEVVKKAVQESGIPAEVTPIHDIGEIITRGILQTPGVTINGKLVMQGKIPTVEQIKELLTKHIQ